MLNILLNKLSNRESSKLVYNQYQNKNLLNNLKTFIEYLLQYNSDVLLIGEAPGYKGCRLTGIPFTSGNVINASKHDIFRDIGSKLVLPKIISENTATILWQFLDISKPVPILWNAFPFHPHQNGNSESNRKPTKLEIEEGKIYLELIFKLFKPKRLCSLGRVGESILKELFSKKITYIRHPSYGGKKDFIEGMKSIAAT